MSARISPRDGSAGLYTEGVQAPQAGLQRPSVRAMRERAVASFFIFCAFLFFTRPGRFFNLAPELLLFADNLDGAFFLPDVFFRLPPFLLRRAGARGPGRWYTAVLSPAATASMVSSSREDMRYLGTRWNLLAVEIRFRFTVARTLSLCLVLAMARVLPVRGRSRLVVGTTSAKSRETSSSLTGPASAAEAAPGVAHSGQNHSSTGTSWRGGSKHSMWYPASQPSQSSSRSSRSLRPHTSQKVGSSFSFSPRWALSTGIFFKILPPN